MGNRRSLASSSEHTRRGSFAALATQTREVSPARPTPQARAYAVSAVEPGRKWFWPGVGGLTAAVAVFLLARLTAWPPHEDETLALFVGRNSLGGLFHTCSDRARRGAAALPLRLARRAPRRRPRGAAALLGALRGRLRARRRAPRAADRRRGPGADRDRARLGELDAPLPRDLRADVQPVPVDERSVVPGLPRRSGPRRRKALGSLGAGGAPHRRDAPVRRARPRLTGGLCPRARAHARCVAGDRLGLPFSGRPSGTATSSLRGASTSGSDPAARSSTARRRCSATCSDVAGDFTVGYTLAIVAVLVARPPWALAPCG